MLKGISIADTALTFSGLIAMHAPGVRPDCLPAIRMDVAHSCCGGSERVHEENGC